MRAGSLSARQARRVAINAQGLGAALPGRAPGRARLRRLVGQLGTVQVDAVNVLARTQFLVPFSRLGGVEPGDFVALCGRGRPCFEYWGHAASVMPVELYPLLRWRMEAQHQREAAVRAAHGDYLDAVLADVRDRGPLTAADLTDPRRRTGEWWERRSGGRVALELLHGNGTLAAWRDASFARRYDLTERVIPAAVLGLPTPSQREAECELLAVAGCCHGVGTAADLANYFMLRGPGVKAGLAELVEAGRLLEVEVEGWAQTAYLDPAASTRSPRRDGATLLSPFDSLIWHRDRTERVFGFHYRIEIYVPGPKRTYGYYVLPLLLGDQLVARFDLKADRAGRSLLVQGAFLEPGADEGAVLEPAAAELSRLARWLGLERVTVGRRGDLAGPLRAIVAGTPPS
jgi:hypothetical protein